MTRYARNLAVVIASPTGFADSEALVVPTTSGPDAYLVERGRDDGFVAGTARQCSPLNLSVHIAPSRLPILQRHNCHSFTANEKEY